MFDKLKIEITPVKYGDLFIGSLRIYWDQKEFDQFYIKDVLGSQPEGVTIYKTSQKTEACQFLDEDFEGLFSDLSKVQIQGPEEWWEDHEIITS